MRRFDVMRVALAFLSGCGAGASGRDIPVYREYTQPVLFYDEQGEQLAFHADAPDRAAFQSVRDVKAREGLMGKETLLDLTFGSGSSVFDDQALQTGKMAPMTDGGEDRRRKKNESGRNWLAKSLSLPSLGQMPTNAAESAISPEEEESSWGWLADEVAGQPDEEAPLPEELRPEEEYNPVAAQAAALKDGSNPYSKDRAAAQAQKEKTEQEPSTSASFPERTDKGMKPSDRATERSEASARDLEGGDRTASTTMKDYRLPPPAIAEMSQTRQAIAEISVGSRPDLSSFRAPAMGASVDPGSGAERAQTGGSSLDFSSSYGGATAWGAFGSRQGTGSRTMGALSPPVSSWQGGWSAQNGGGGGSVLSRFESPSAPAPAATPPLPAPGSSRPGISSGGYKPAWF